MGTQQRLKCNGMHLSYLLMALHVVVEAHYILLQMHAHLEWVMEQMLMVDRLLHASGSSSPDKGTYVFTALSTRPYQHFIKDLTHNGTYYVRILAYNAVGPGDYCNKDGFDCDGNELTLSL